MQNLEGDGKITLRREKSLERMSLPHIWVKIITLSSSRARHVVKFVPDAVLKWLCF